VDMKSLEPIMQFRSNRCETSSKNTAVYYSLSFDW
jgi:hypothetical protein